MFEHTKIMKDEEIHITRLEEEKKRQDEMMRARKV